MDDLDLRPLRDDLWTAAEIAIVDNEWLAGGRAEEISANVGRTIRATQYKLGERIAKGILPRRPDKWGPKLDDLKRMYTDGASASVIGAALGFTRNAIIGKIHRERAAGRMERRPDDMPVKAKTSERPIRVRKIVSRPIVAPQSFHGQDWHKIHHKPDMGRIALLDTKPNECRWICDNGLCCGAAASDAAHPWCGFHHAIVFSRRGQWSTGPNDLRRFNHYGGIGPRVLGLLQSRSEEVA